MTATRSVNGRQALNSTARVAARRARRRPARPARAAPSAGRTGSAAVPMAARCMQPAALSQGMVRHWAGLSGSIEACQSKTSTSYQRSPR